MPVLLRSVRDLIPQEVPAAMFKDAESHI